MLKKLVQLGLVVIFVLTLSGSGFSQSAEKEKAQKPIEKKTTRVRKETIPDLPVS